MTAEHRAEQAPASDRAHLMTMRVTRIRNGRVVEQRDEVQVAVEGPLELMQSWAWPPCECPHHRGR